MASTTGDVPQLDRIRINEQIALKVSGRSGERYYRSRVEDITPEGIVVALPTESEELVSAQDGTTVYLVKTAGDCLFSLGTQVVQRVLSPVPSLTLLSSGEWTRIQRRLDVRLAIVMGPITAVIGEGDDARTLEITVLNLSAGGVLFRAPERLPIWTVLKIELTMADTPGPIGTEIQVVRHDDDDEKAKHYRMGARFLNLHQRTRDHIVKFIFQEQLRRRRLGQT